MILVVSRVMFLAFRTLQWKNVAFAHLSSPNSIRISSLNCLRGLDFAGHSLQRVFGCPYKRDGLLCCHIFIVVSCIIKKFAKGYQSNTKQNRRKRIPLKCVFDSA